MNIQTVAFIYKQNLNKKRLLTFLTTTRTVEILKLSFTNKKLIMKKNKHFNNSKFAYITKRHKVGKLSREKTRQNPLI